MWAAISFDLDNTLVDRDAAAAAVLAEHSPPSNDPEKLARWLRHMIPRFLGPDPTVLEVTRRVGAGHRMVLISNGGRTQRRKLEAAGLRGAFEQLYISGEIGVRKPAAAIFRRATAQLGIDPARMLHVGDDPDLDVAGASAAGLATCWVSHGRDYPATQPHPTLMIEDITALPEALGC